MSTVVQALPQRVKQLGERVENAVSELSTTYTSKDKHKTGCRKCGKNVPQGSGIFCSLPCTLDYWKDFQAHYNTRISKDESRLCGLPGCRDQCYVKNDGTVHDFCGKTHADEYKQLNEAIKPTGNAGGGRGGEKKSSDGTSKQPPSGTGSSRSGSTQSSNNTGGSGGILSRWRKKSPPTGPILFYRLEDPYYEFTNFYYAPITLDDKRWPTTEHYFQAQKFVGTCHVEAIRMLTRPREAFEYSRKPSVSRWQRGDWESVKIDVMRKALLAKFDQHDDLRQKLIETRGRPLIEHSPFDSFWGDGSDGKGQNHLGQLLMEIRSILVTGSHS